MNASDKELPAALQGALDGMDKALDAMEASLEPVLSVSFKTLAAQLPPLANGRLNTTLAFIATCITYAHLRIGGSDTSSHPIQSEVQAARKLFARIDEAEKSASEVAVSRATTTPSVAARMIKHSLAGGEQTVSGRVRPRESVESEPLHSSEDEDVSETAAVESKQKKLRGEMHNDISSKAAGRTPAKSEKHTPGKAHTKPPAEKSTEKKHKATHLDDKKRSTPQPKMSHLTWKDEMTKKFGK